LNQVDRYVADRGVGPPAPEPSTPPIEPVGASA